MVTPTLELARRGVVAGFLLLVLSSFANLAYLGSTVFDSGWRYATEFSLDPVASLLTLVAWWYVLQTQPSGTTQRRLLASAYAAFALKHAVLAVAHLDTARTMGAFTRATASFWFATCGECAITLGFAWAYLVIRSLAPAPNPSGSTSPGRRAVSRLIPLGYAVSAVSALVVFYDEVTNPLFTVGGFYSELQMVLEPLAALAAVVAWWYLSRLEVYSVAQRYFVSRGFFALGLSLGAVAIQEFLTVSEVMGSPYVAEMWISAVGSVIAAVGLILTSRHDGAVSAPAVSPATLHT